MGLAGEVGNLQSEYKKKLLRLGLAESFRTRLLLVQEGKKFSSV